VLTSLLVLLKVLEAKPQLASYSAFTTGFNCLHYAAGMLMLLLNFMLNCNSFVMSTWGLQLQHHVRAIALHWLHDGVWRCHCHLLAPDCIWKWTNIIHEAWLLRHDCLGFAAKGHMAVLQAAVEAVKLGTKESLSQDNDDISMKHVRAWSKLLKDCLNQKGSRGETPVMVACEEG